MVKTKHFFFLALTALIITFFLNILTVAQKVSDNKNYDLEKNYITLYDEAVTRLTRLFGSLQEYNDQVCGIYKFIPLKNKSTFKNLNSTETGIYLTRLIFLIISLIIAAILLASELNKKLSKVFHKKILFNVSNIINLILCGIFSIMSLAMFGVMIAVRVCDSEINDNFGSESSVYSFYNNTEMSQPSDIYGRIVKSRANTHIALNFILFILLLGTAIAHLLAIIKGPSEIEDDGNTIPISDSATMGQWGEKVDKVNKIPRRGDSESIKPMKISVMGSLNSSKTDVKSELHNNLNKKSDFDDNNGINIVGNNNNNNTNIINKEKEDNKEDGDSNDDGENDSNKEEEE
jgi:hypothetical protein